MTMIHDQQTVRLGRRPPRIDNRTLRLAAYVTPGKLPEAPPAYDSGSKVQRWGMLANDKLGDCVLEGTSVIVPNVTRGYRSTKYDGPAVRITLASGKKLSVTANHLVFTPRGAVPAKLIKEGDDLIGTCRPEIFPDLSCGGGKPDLNQKPSLAQEKFASLNLGRGASRKIMPTPIDLHGDGQFINGNVDVVGSNGFLGGEFNPPLCQPHAQAKISAARKLQGDFHRFGAALLGRLRCFAASLGDIGLCCEGSAFGYGHSGVAQANGMTQGAHLMTGRHNSFFKPASVNAVILANFFHGLASKISADRFGKVHIFELSAQRERPTVRPELIASRGKAPADGVIADANFVSNILNAFPGIVALERVANVEVGHFNGPVYDFTTEQGWYAANGILTHNCTVAGILHQIMLWDSQDSPAPHFTDGDAISLYQMLCGYVPGKPETDQGGIEIDILNAWRKTPIFGHQLAAYVAVDPKNWSHVKLAHWLFGSLYLGLNLPDTAQNEQLWSDTRGVPGSWGGHCVVSSAYSDRAHCFDETTLTVITWGEPKKMTRQWLAKYCDELYAPLSPTWLGNAGRAPNGFDMDQLSADLARL